MSAPASPTELDGAGPVAQATKLLVCAYRTWVRQGRPAYAACSTLALLARARMQAQLAEAAALYEEQQTMWAGFDPAADLCESAHTRRLEALGR